MTRWKTINKALDLPYDEPQEIYSTSPELYHDLGIPTDAKGRIKPAREPRETAETREERPARSRRGGEARTEGDGERTARKRSRTRKRTRSGQLVDEKSEADVTSKTQVPPTEESSTEAAEAPQQERKPRKRTRKTAETKPEVQAEVTT